MRVGAPGGAAQPPGDLRHIDHETLIDLMYQSMPETTIGIFPDVGQYGSVFNQIVRQSAEGIPQIAVVHGACTAGGAYVPAFT